MWTEGTTAFERYASCFAYGFDTLTGSISCGETTKHALSPRFTGSMLSASVSTEAQPLGKSLSHYLTSFHWLPLLARPCSACTEVRRTCLVDLIVAKLDAGLSPDMNGVDDINQLDRFQEIPHEGLFSDLMWSDPDGDPSNPLFTPSQRYGGFLGSFNRLIEVQWVWAPLWDDGSCSVQSGEWIQSHCPGTSALHGRV